MERSISCEERGMDFAFPTIQVTLSPKLNMVYTGKPSGGCYVCKIRRIKCDQQYPECSYCIKMGQNCPGYNDSFDLAWKDHTAGSKRSIERRKRTTEKPSLRTERSKSLMALESPHDNQAVTLCHSGPGHLPPAVAENPWEPALSFFFSTYARSSNYVHESRGFLEHVHLLYQAAAPQSTLRFSTLAVATFLLGSWINRTHESKISRMHYANAVSAMKEQLTSSPACSNDEMLMAILLLQLYETLVGTIKKSPSSRAHLAGAMAIVKHRGVDNFNSKLSHGLLLCIRSQLIGESFKSHKSIPPDILTWSKVRPEADQSPLIRWETITMDLANLWAIIHSGLNGKLGLQRGNMEQIYNRALEIEQRLTLWYSTLPPSWCPIRVSAKEYISEGIPAARPYQQLCDVYPSISIASAFNRFRISVIRTKSIILTCLSQQPRSLTSLRSQASCLNQIQQMADDICASIPFHLGDKTEPGYMGDKSIRYPHAPGKELPDGHYVQATAMGGWQLLEPLRGLLTMRIKLRTGQREWIGGQMMRIAKIYHFDT